MPAYIVKPSKDEDFYVYWSDVTDNPHAWGPRKEVEDALKDWGLDHSEQRWARTDETGTSARHGFHHWEDPGFIFREQGWVKRENLKAVLNTFDEKTGEFESDLIEPLDSDVRG